MFWCGNNALFLLCGCPVGKHSNLTELCLSMKPLSNIVSGYFCRFYTHKDKQTDFSFMLDVSCFLLLEDSFSAILLASWLTWRWRWFDADLKADQACKNLTPYIYTCISHLFADQLTRTYVLVVWYTLSKVLLWDSTNMWKRRQRFEGNYIICW